MELGILRGNPIELAADGVVALLFPHGIGHLLGLDVHDMEDLADRAGYAPGRERSKQFGLHSLRLDRDLGARNGRDHRARPLPRARDSGGSRADPRGRRSTDRKRLAAFADVRGIRIEDDVLVTANGRDVLTQAIPKKPDDVEASLSR